MKLVYLYVGKSERTLQRIGINFSDSFDISYSEKNSFHIERKESKVHIYNEKIEEMTVLVGKNGCGKTSLLDLLYFRNKNEIQSILGNDGYMFRMYHLYDSDDIGHFLLEEYSKLSRLEQNSANSRFIQRSIHISFDYNSQEYEFIKSHYSDKTGNKTVSLYRPISKTCPWFQANSYVDEKGAAAILLHTMNRTLLDYLRDSIQTYKKQEELQRHSLMSSVAFETNPKGLDYVIDWPFSKERWKEFSCEGVNIVEFPDSIKIEMNRKDMGTELLLRGLCKLYQDVCDQYIEEDFVKIDISLAQEFLDENYNEAMDKDIATLIPRILYRCNGWWESTKNHRGEQVSCFIIASVMALVLAVQGDIYAAYIDRCYRESVLNNPNFNDEQKKAWDTSFHILSIFTKDGELKWKNPIPATCFTRDRKQQICINVYTYDFYCFENSYEEDSLCKLLYICDRLDQYHFKSEDRNDITRFYRPAIWVSGMSTGEMEYVDLFASIYGGLLQVYNPKNMKDSNDMMILIMDEPDGTFHPEWSRKFIKTLIDLLQSEPFLYYPCKFQLVLTTHSPIMLSDIASRNIRCLDIENGVTVVKQAEYGLMSNINDLMVNSFFVGKPFGTFAESYVSGLMRQVQEYAQGLERKEYEEIALKREGILESIDMISEPYVKSVLIKQMEKADSKNTDFRKKLLEEKKRQIEDELRRLNGEVES